jgi:RimJ/RimL family protein N-acetyltransferase
MATTILSTERHERSDGRQQMLFHVPLRYGGIVLVRPIRPDDTEHLQAFHARLSPESIAFRYFHPVPVLSPEWVQRLTHIDYENRMALVATIGGGADEQIIAVVRYERTDPTTAEVAFLVEDRWQGHGIATQLLYRLAAYAVRRGLTTFVAEIMSTNTAMRDVVRLAGFPFTTRYETGCVEMRMDISNPPSAPFSPPRAGDERRRATPSGEGGQCGHDSGCDVQAWPTMVSA